MSETHEASRPISPFTLQVSEPELWQRVVKVEVSQDYFDREYGRRLRRAVQDHVKPGFRKGKTPKALVERELGDQLRAHTLEHVIPEAFKAAIVEHGLVPLSDPEVSQLVFKPGQPISFEMAIEVRPKITARDYQDLPLKRRAAAVPEEAVDSVLERLRENRAIWEAVERPSRTGDQVVMDLVPLDEEGQPLEEERAADQVMTLGTEYNIEAFEEAMTGVTAGTEREVRVTYPSDHHSERLRGRTVGYHCHVKSVQEKRVPDLDDAFAGQFKPGQTLLELRTAIRQDLHHEEEHRIQRELEEQAVDALIARNDITVPPSLVEQYLKTGLEELHGRNAQLGRPNSEEEDRHYREVTRPAAERVLKGMFIMEAIRRQEGLAVDDEELEQRITEIAREHNFDLEKYRDYVGQGPERDRIVHGLEERKTFDFLLSRARIENGATGQQEAEGS
jgi:trigger factor